MDYHALANDVVDETLKCELCCCILLRMGSRFTSSPQGRESSIKKGADFAFAFYGYRVYPLDEAYLFALRGSNFVRCKPERCRAVFSKRCPFGTISLLEGMQSQPNKCHFASIQSYAERLGKFGLHAK